ncbi:MAG: phosphate transport system regulatory protein PhoU [Candidatus Puniceispirillum sp.]|nr:phosphate transport system regulatory protein PhoU [Candidatus Puniceispirillum sp.]
MAGGHIVKSYDEDLKKLNQTLEHMGEMAVQQLENAVLALTERNEMLAAQVIAKDQEVDALEHKVDTFAIQMIALRQPVARDLRHVVAALKIASHLERIADYARNVSRRALELNTMPQSQGEKALPRLAKVTIAMIQDAIVAYINSDVELALKVWEKDQEVDEMYTSYLRELLTYMMEDTRQIGPCTQLLFAAKNIERAGDHAANIAEIVHYFVEGVPFKDPRLPY